MRAVADTATAQQLVYRERLQIATKLAMLRAAVILAQYRDGMETSLDEAQDREPGHARIIEAALVFLTEVENDLARQGKTLHPERTGHD